MGNALQGSVLVPLVFKMSVSDWFTMVDKTTLPVMRLVTHHMYRDSRPQILSVPWRLFKWFSNNQFNANRDKYHLTRSLSKSNNIAEHKIQSSDYEELFGIKIDREL